MATFHRSPDAHQKPQLCQTKSCIVSSGMVAHHEQTAGLLEGAGSLDAAEVRGDDTGRFTPPVRAHELVEDPAEAAAVEPEGWGLRRHGPRAVAGVPCLLRLPSRPPAGPHIGVSSWFMLDGGARGRRR